VTIADFLRTTSLDRVDAFALLSHCFARNKAWLIAHAEEEIPAAQFAQLRAQISRREAGEPIAYIVGKKEFYGRDFLCTPDVLVPRPETELLVELALQHGDAMGREVRVLDLGTGTGCIGLTLQCERPAWRVTASDVSPAALEIARRNQREIAKTAPQVLGVSFIESPWFEALGDARFDLIVSNPPYLAHDDVHLRGDGVRYEPRGALTDEHDGLQVYREIARSAPAFLRGGGSVLMEHGFTQAESVTQIFQAENGWRNITTREDLAGLPRVTIANLIA
jgi:release factor glutamine methyltransferase